jgi:hypothetical protein
MNKVTHVSELDLEKAVHILNEFAHNGCKSWIISIPKWGIQAGCKLVVARNFSSKTLTPFEALVISRNYERQEPFTKIFDFLVECAEAGLGEKAADVLSVIIKQVEEGQATLPIEYYRTKTAIAKILGHSFYSEPETQPPVIQDEREDVSVCGNCRFWIQTQQSKTPEEYTSDWGYCGLSQANLRAASTAVVTTFLQGDAILTGLNACLKTKSMHYCNQWLKQGDEIDN